jgi:hypothetical protein
MLISLTWLACGAVAFGLTFAYFQGEYPTVAEKMRCEHYVTAAVFALLGPAGLFVALLCGSFGKYGWRILPKR